eukprot:CAMPEP_0204240390 /NCGR_PEP_ID=MMETSP0361-20130328/94861_1 /ASSEMBLY_ACC=CAM_ASM_000343 /TAXON_ID=268821 /ORGANISM="Scrippsiella Hangoei, Strain SHTV-5" /LENGTH=128 /DNA_ID=CAMNT_0051213193 /DNA_START=528 /DNA_END=915 /DNA_ORIENTATION=+
MAYNCALDLQIVQPKISKPQQQRLHDAVHARLELLGERDWTFFISSSDHPRDSKKASASVTSPSFPDEHCRLVRSLITGEPTELCPIKSQEQVLHLDSAAADAAQSTSSKRDGSATRSCGRRMALQAR